MTNPSVVAGLIEAFAPCTPQERQQANNHLNELVSVGGRQAVIQAYIPISGNPADRIKVTFPANAGAHQQAPAQVQTMIDGLVFAQNP